MFAHCERKDSFVVTRNANETGIRKRKPSRREQITADDGKFPRKRRKGKAHRVDAISLRRRPVAATADDDTVAAIATGFAAEATAVAAAATVTSVTVAATVAVVAAAAVAAAVAAVAVAVA